ncbi:MAG TPA: FMN-binding protein [Ktedonobacterales bacterium]|nr:FMN-binding protein [Ktedonobacterales bacterium]
MKRLVVSVVVIGTFVFYILIHGRAGPPTASALAPHATGGSATTPGSASTATASAVATATTPAGSLYRDGSYLGSVADAQWGYVQIKAIVQGGKLTDVQWVQYPNDRSRSIEINSYADPVLTSEAIQAQSAQVDFVTGATDSSFAFMQSLGDALSQAQA